MSQLPTDRAALDDYMAVWFRDEISDTIELRSMVVSFRTELQERVSSRRVVIDHLENFRGCPTYRVYETVRKRDKDVAEMDY
ncbi:hypothetical protein Tco_1252533 [Tanacetum coccineum]